MELPIELQRDLDKGIQYVIYHARNQLSTELQLDHRDPAPILDATIGYQVMFTAFTTENGWKIAEVGIVGLVDSERIPDNQRDWFGED